MTNLNAAPRDPLVGCGQRHRAYFEPRPLCEVGEPIDVDGQSAPLLRVSVSACPPEVAGTRSLALVIMHGELDTYGATQIHEPVHEYARFASHVVLDLSMVTLIDSGGIVFIEALQRALLRRGGSLTIHDPSLMVERILQICGTSQSIPTCRPTTVRASSNTVVA